MSFFRVALFLAATLSPVFAAEPQPAATTTTAKTAGSEAWRRFVPEQYPAYVPLTEIAVYQLQAAASVSDLAMSGLATEIKRLANYSRTLEIGAERRALASKLFGLEDRLYALGKTFDQTAWESLRADVRAEWLAIQAAQTPVGIAVATSTGSPATTAPQAN